MSKKILVLPGDGVGPEVTSSAVSVLKAAAGDFIDIAYADIGSAAFDTTDHHLPAGTIDLATDADAIIVGTVVDQTSDRNYQNPVRTLKKQLNLYIVMRKFFPLCNRIGSKGVDIILMTGNPDSLLNISETESLDGVTTQKFLSNSSCKRLFRKVLQTAEAKGRKHVTCVHRVAAFPMSDGLFLNAFYREFAATDMLVNDMEVELAASEMVMDPPSMDVIVSTDLYGSVLAGVGAGLVGGSYLTPMGSIGDSSGLFEPMHGPRPEMADKGSVNPTSSILSAAMALDHVGLRTEAENIRIAVRSAYAANNVTPDVGGSLNTSAFTEAVIEAVKNNKLHQGR
ncbi:MAG: hypothetical protein LBT41_05355 [Candidatus Methanoplasma sp.]|jgi:isocitrate/isopropylmalate dehydrogenase|nr:hypothetical protein [Candidatus Methanoplasma sp.]